MQHDHSKLSVAIDMKKPAARAAGDVDGAQGRRGGRELRAGRDEADGLCLRGSETRQSEDHHVLDFDGGTDRAALAHGPVTITSDRRMRESPTASAKRIARRQ